MPHPYGKMKQATIKARRRTHDGNLVRTANREYSESSHSEFLSETCTKKAVHDNIFGIINAQDIS